MKSNKVYFYSAVMSTLMKFYNLKDIADCMIELIHEIDPSIQFDLYKVKSDGFIMRRKDSNQTKSNITATIYKSFYKATEKLVDDSADGIQSYMSDQYDIEYDSDQIDSKFAEFIVDIDINGRLVTVSFDIY